MFTGIVEEVGRVAWKRSTDGGMGGDVRVRIEAATVLSDLAIGDSVAVSGCCLTAVAIDDAGFEVELSSETLAKTAPRWQGDARVNLERAMAADGRFGGHIVSGHVEAIGEVLAVTEAAGAYIVTVRAPERLAPYLIPKGSITVDGVSLTVVDVGGPGGSGPALAAHEFTLWLIPHTLEVTTLGEMTPGAAVNLEADLMAKYIERMALLQSGAARAEEANRVP
jgi:riboflavin synthase